MSQLMKQGVPFLLSSAAVILYMKIDLVMLEQIRGSRDAGLYAASVRACEVGLLAPITFISVMTPRLYAASSDQIRDVFTLATIWMSRICAATMLLGLVLGVPLFPILYSDGFKEAVPVFACLLPSIIFLGIGLLTRTLMVKSSRHWALTIGHGSAAVLNIGLNFLLIPDYGMYGAAIATIASYACATFIPVCLVSENRWAINVIVRSFRLF
jgi:O-antigen/teichoic acid export membrane protein